MATVNGTSFASPLATAKYVAGAFPAQLEPVIQALSQTSIWAILLTVLAVAVAYDQSRQSPLFFASSFAHALRGCAAHAKHPFAVSYLSQKGSIVGPAWKTPFIGPFLQSMDPKFEEYYGKWISGPLSCVSVFHK